MSASNQSSNQSNNQSNNQSKFDAYSYITFPAFQDMHNVLNEHRNEITNLRERTRRLEDDNSEIKRIVNNNIESQHTNNWFLWTSVILLALIKKS